MKICFNFDHIINNKIGIKAIKLESKSLQYNAAGCTITLYQCLNELCQFFMRLTEKHTIIFNCRKI